MKKKVVNEEPLNVEVASSEPEVKVLKGKVIAKMLNVRPDASMNRPPLRILYEGDKIKYTVENDEWYKLDDGGYVMAKFIK